MENNRLERLAEEAKNGIDNVIYDLISEIESKEALIREISDSEADLLNKISDLEEEIEELKDIIDELEKRLNER
jgi:septal ring factor EnvC (AmiA/AmiB activator)